MPVNKLISASNGCGNQARVHNLSNNYNTNESSELVSPVFNYRATTVDPMLRFDHIYKTKNN